MEAGRQDTQRYQEYIYQHVQQFSIEQVSRAEPLSFERIEGIFKHQYAQKKNLDGTESDRLESMRSVSANDIRISLPLSGMLKLENSSKSLTAINRKRSLKC